MKNTAVIFLILFLPGTLFFSQTLTCPSPYVYMDGGSYIKYYDPSQPLSSTNPATLNIPTFGSGLTLMPNINGGSFSPTFYTTSGGTYWYWSGTSWVNTGHSTGNSAAVNLGGCGGTIYNIVGSTGQIYSYNGSGNGTLLTTITNFNGGGPYDLVTDCNCNFYALNTSGAPGLTMYSPTGVAQCTYSLSGMPNSTAGGGFAIIGNMIYVKNNNASPGGFYIGTIGGSGITFTTVSGFTGNPGDFASCPVCYASTNLNGSAISSGLLGCTIPTVNLVVTTTASPVTYSWTGPGILGATNGSVVLVNTPGMYTCVVYASGCPPASATLITGVFSNSTSVMASITPSGNICISGTPTTQLIVAHSATTDLITWTGSAMVPIFGVDTINVPPGSYSVSVTDIFNGCVGKDVVNIIQSPTVSLALSDNTLCASNLSGSPASITIVPSGATNYTLLTTSNFSITSPNGPVMTCYATTLLGNTSPTGTVTLIGSNSFCSDTTDAYISIIPNPVVSLSLNSASICPSNSQFFFASGATNYAWSGSFGLNTYFGNSVMANPSAVTSVYHVIGESGGCFSAVQSTTLTVLPTPTLTIAPGSSTICLGNSVNLNVTGNATSYLWYPSASLSFSTGTTVNASPSNTQLYTVLGTLNSCTNTAIALVNIMQPPVLAIGLSSNSVCAQNFYGSPNSVAVFPSGALSYTLLAGNTISVFSPNGPVMTISPSGPAQLVTTIETLTLLGVSGVCSLASTKTLAIIPNPVLSITPPSSSICPGNNQGFVSSGAATYTWFPALGLNQISGNTILANPSITTFYSVIGNSGGCISNLKSAVLIILPIPSVSVTPGTSTVCSGAAIALSASGNGGSYVWSPSTALSSIYGAYVISSPFTSQTYTVVATLNTCTNSAIATVSAIPIPVITASASQYAVCSGAKTNLNAYGASSFEWLPTSGLSFPSGNAVMASPNANTTYTVHGYNGICTGSTTIFIQTVPRPEMEITSTVNQVCLGNSCTISVSGAQTYTWMPTGGLFFVSSNTLVSAAPKTTTNYTVLGATSVGTVFCYQQLSYSVMVVPAIDAKVSGSVTLCLGEKATLNASGGNTFSWAPSQGLNISNGSGVVASPTISTTYTVDISQNTFCGVSTTVLVEVNPRPQVFAGRDTSYNLSEPIFINAKGTGTLTWVGGEDILCRDCPLTQVYPTRDGCYIIQAINEYGCKATDEVCIEVTEDFSAYIPNTFTPNNDGVNDVFLIYGENISNISMEIYDRWGALIFSSDDYTVGWDGRYKGSRCEAGVYTYVIKYTGLNRKKYTKTGNVNIMK